MGVDGHYKRDGNDVKKEGRKKKETKDGEGKWHFEYLLIPLIDTVCTLSISE